MPDPTADSVARVLSAVVDPALDRPLAELGMIRGVEMDGAVARVSLAQPAPDMPARDVLTQRIRAAVETVDGVGTLEVHESLIPQADLPGLLRDLGFRPAEAGIRESVFKTGDSNARVIAVASGKGGVGKSSLTTNLAVALAGLGASVGALDADVWGFSVPRMLGVTDPPGFLGTEQQGFVVPPVAYGVRCVSMGFFTDEDQPVMWRGPMLHKAMEQFLIDVYWGNLDYLVIDMPPGTGDIALSMSQFLPTAEILVVTTPQPAAQRVAQRAGRMAERVNHKVIGVVENMSWLDLGDGNRRTLFGEGGGAALAGDLGVPLLGQVPLDERLREGADIGEPVVALYPDSDASKAIVSIAESIHAMGRRKIRRPELRIKT